MDGRANPSGSAAEKICDFGLLFVFALFLRLPFFFPAVVDWDESTYVLMGQSIVDGHLPYLQQWENQPLLGFLFHAAAIVIFGRDLVAIRLMAALCVATTGVVVYLIGRRLWNRRLGLFTALVTVAAISLVRSGQAMMMEHAALPFLLGGLYLLIGRNLSTGSFFAAGMLLAAAAQVRLNLAYVAAAVGLYLLATAEAPRQAVKRFFAYAAAGILVIGLFWLPYALAGAHGLWWKSVVSANLAYAGAQHSAVRNAVRQARLSLHIRLIAFIWLAALAGLATIALNWKRFRAFPRSIALVLLFAVFTGVSILESGPAYDHYQIQVLPFVVLLAGTFINQLPARMQIYAFLAAGLIALVSLGPILHEYGIMGSRLHAHEPLRHGAAYEIADYLRRENSSRRPVFLMTDHITYWFLNMYPPTRFVHPSNLAKEYLLHAVVGENDSTVDELTEIFQKRPQFVVLPPVLRYLRGEARELLEEILEDDYAIVTRIGERKIYRRISAESETASALRVAR